MDLRIKMSLRLYIICSFVVLSLMSTAVADSTATIHGAVYKWDTFEPLDNTVIEVNSTPTQHMVAKNGQYSIGLIPGNYTVTARYYQNSTLYYSKEETIVIKDEEDYVLDLLLLPINSKGLIDSSGENISSRNINESAKNSTHNLINPVTDTAIDKANNSNGVDITELRTPPAKQGRLYSSVLSYLLMALIFVLILAGGYLFVRKHRQIEMNTFQEEKTRFKTGDLSEFDNMSGHLEVVYNKGSECKGSECKGSESKEGYPAQATELAESGLEEENGKNSLIEPAHNPVMDAPTLKTKLKLSADMKEITGIIRSQGGQISQKDLRSKLKCSEVKVSLLLADLEKKKMIKKFKRGRENVVVLIDGKR